MNDLSGWQMWDRRHRRNHAVHSLPCAGFECGAVFHSMFTNLAHARRAARAAGWKADEVTKTQWCPGCSEARRTGRKRLLPPETTVAITVIPGRPGLCKPQPPRSPRSPEGWSE